MYLFQHFIRFALRVSITFKIAVYPVHGHIGLRHLHVWHFEAVYKMLPHICLVNTSNE